MKGKKKYLVILGIVIIVAIVIAATFKSKSQDQDSSKASIYVDVASVEKADLSSTITTKGTVVAKASAKVYSEVVGIVADVFVEEGDVVTAGQAIVAMDTERLDQRIRDAKLQWEIAQINYENATNYSSLDASVKSAKTAYENASNDYEDSKVMFANGALSQKDLDSSKQKFDLAYNAYMEAINTKSNKSSNSKVLKLTAEKAKNEYDDLLLQKEKASIKTPMAGTVSKVDIKKYDMTVEGTPIAIIETVDDLEVLAHIGEYDINKIKVGMPAKITGYGVGDEQYEGKVTFVGSSAEVTQAGQSTEKSVLVKVEFDEKTEFKPNFTADLEIEYAKADEATVVPYETLLNIDKDIFVIKLVDGKAHKVKVELGVQGDLSVEIKSEEIKEGDQLILSPSMDIEEGMAVNLLGEGK
ncbi:efflux RND transporter periplasmic adaptor subunit [Fusibacter ferrireducens]|uniref:HlyD family efflux transporter periplasmic adaptor subunit n=1 Tax=Fusibacter ferrireducens TaxID=2785058 RepID=A0ABR9ZRV9_9FIRM|nr:HlyD family efflux transporter periplasmic adaptor subunit [Fusibacter ferrireducens]MBF4693185.1 HlyD family efflux transporter periplasmic adaptor subunit [Fusibacter ferrireducens]